MDLALFDLLCWRKEYLQSGKKCDRTKRLFLQADFFQAWVISDAILSRQELVLRQSTVLNLDRSGRLNESSLIAVIQSLMPNVPLQLWQENKEKDWFSKTSCGRCGRIKSNCVIMIAQKLPVSPIFKNYCLSLNFGRRCLQMYHCSHILCFYLRRSSYRHIVLL